MFKRFRFLYFFGWVIFALEAQGNTTAVPYIITTLKPLHSWVSFLMQGRGEPLLLFEKKVSPHTASLSPQDVLFLKKADKVIWFGPSVELGFSKIIQSLPAVNVITLQNNPAFEWLALREHVNTLEDQHTHHHPLGVDGHIWLDPLRVKKIVRFLAYRLIAMDPAFQDLYLKNLKALEQKLTSLHKLLEKQLKAFREKPFIVFHDAYQYFEKRYQLKTLDVILASPESPLKPKRFGNVLELVAKNPDLCVFLEPQFEASRILVFLKSHDIRVGQLDPLGYDIPAGPHFYEMLMRQLVEDFELCFKKSTSNS